MGAVTQRDIELTKMPPLSEQFPIVFNNGYTFTGISGHCKACQRTIEDGLFSGQVSQHNEHMYSVEGVGICEPCKTLTRFVYRLYDDKRIVTPKNGRWLTYMPKQSWSEKLTFWLKSLFL